MRNLWQFLTQRWGPHEWIFPWENSSNPESFAPWYSSKVTKRSQTQVLNSKKFIYISPCDKPEIIRIVIRAIAFKRIQGGEDFFKNARREGGSKR